MRLTTRPSFWLSESKPKSQQLPASKTESLIPGWVWAIFVISVLLFVSTLYVTSWTTTGPTFFPIEASSPFQAPFSPLEPQLPDAGKRYLPEFLQLPANAWEILVPLAAVTGLCIALRVIPSNNWTRLVINSLVVCLGVRYLIWRTFGNTLNFTTGLSTGLSLWMYAAEIYGFLILALSSFQKIWSHADKRSTEADRYERQIRAGEYLPTVDVLIPTYNEQEFIIRRTVLGCQALDYPNKKIYICDDARRANIRALAEELGCGYVTQPEGFVNKHAKAGNLTNALSHTDGELIAIFDADFVPFKNFLMRTIGFFQQSKVALVQTPQDFYNPDYHVRNLGVGHLYPNDLQQFFRHEQSIRDAAETAMCCGTSFVLRRSALESIGGFYKRCIPEDSSTSILLSTRGWRVVYLNETLSMGESPRNYRDFIKQRLRWLQGNLQIFLRYKDIPIWTTPHMTWFQKSYYVTWLLACFGPFLRATFLILPLLCLYLGVSNYIGTFAEFIYYTAPNVLLIIVASGWASHHHISHFYNELYETILCFPSIRTILNTIKSPFKAGFKVTAKGVTADSKSYNLQFTWPLIVLIVLTVLMLTLQMMGKRMGIWEAINSEEFGLLFFWMSYNIVWLSLAVLAAIDQPERRKADRFPLRTACKVSWNGSPVWGHTNDLSEGGANVSLLADKALPKGAIVEFELLDHTCMLKAKVIRSRLGSQFTTTSLQFSQVSLEQNRQLVNLLFGEMAWWKESRRPSALDSLLAILASFLKLQPIRSTYRSGN